LYLDGPGKIELLGLGLRCFVPFLQDFGECCTVDLDELLEFVQIVAELLEAFFESCELCRASRCVTTPRLKNLLLV
jgi:hypothetical protein